MYEADPTGLANILAQLTCQTLPNMCTGDPHLISGGVRESGVISVPAAVPHTEPVGIESSGLAPANFAMESDALFNRPGALCMLLYSVVLCTKKEGTRVPSLQ